MERGAEEIRRLGEDAREARAAPFEVAPLAADGERHVARLRRDAEPGEELHEVRIGHLVVDEEIPCRRALPGRRRRHPRCGCALPGAHPARTPVRRAFRAAATPPTAPRSPFRRSPASRILPRSAPLLRNGSTDGIASRDGSEPSFSGPPRRSRAEYDRRTDSLRSTKRRVPAPRRGRASEESLMRTAPGLDSPSRTHGFGPRADRPQRGRSRPLGRPGPRRNPGRPARQAGRVHGRGVRPLAFPRGGRTDRPPPRGRPPRLRRLHHAASQEAPRRGPLLRGGPRPRRRGRRPPRAVRAAVASGRHRPSPPHPVGLSRQPGGRPADRSPRKSRLPRRPGRRASPEPQGARPASRDGRDPPMGLCAVGDELRRRGRGRLPRGLRGRGVLAHARAAPPRARAAGRDAGRASPDRPALEPDGPGAPVRPDRGRKEPLHGLSLHRRRTSRRPARTPRRPRRRDLHAAPDRRPPPRSREAPGPRRGPREDLPPRQGGVRHDRAARLRDVPDPEPGRAPPRDRRLGRLRTTRV